MQRVVKQSRALLYMLVCLLVFAPTSVLATEGETKQIDYVALGDSLAAGILSDNTLGFGYVSNIASNLESRGYEVNLLNKGVPGATSEDVLSELPEIAKLADADIITISVGANDVLAGLDPSLLVGFDPKYLAPGEAAKLEQALQGAKVGAERAGNAALHAIDEAKEPVDAVQSAIQRVTDTLEEVIEEIEPYEHLLPRR